MKILTRSDEIKDILSNKIDDKYIIDLILRFEKDILMKETIKPYESYSPIYSGIRPDGYFFSLKKHHHILYDKDCKLMNHIRVIGGSLEQVRKELGERIWGKYLNTLRF